MKKIMLLLVLMFSVFLIGGKPVEASSYTVEASTYTNEFGTFNVFEGESSRQSYKDNYRQLRSTYISKEETDYTSMGFLIKLANTGIDVNSPDIKFRAATEDFSIYAPSEFGGIAGEVISEDNYTVEKNSENQTILIKFDETFVNENKFSIYIEANLPIIQDDYYTPDNRAKIDFAWLSNGVNQSWGMYNEIRFIGDGVTVNLLDNETQEVLDFYELSTTNGNEIGTPYTVIPPEDSKGYYYDHSDQPLEGIHTEKKQTVNLYMKRDLTSLYAHSMEIEIGNEWTPEDAFDSATDKYGNDIEYSNITVGGDTVNVNKIGTYTVYYSYNNKVSSEVTINVVAKQTIGYVTIKYVNSEGKEILSTVKESGAVGLPYNIVPMEIKGYRLKTNQLPENSKGYYSEEDQIVTFYYEEITPEIPETPETIIPNNLITPMEFINVKEETPKSSNFPQTGEKKSAIVSGLGIVTLMAVGLFYVLKRKSEKIED